MSIQVYWDNDRQEIIRIDIEAISEASQMKEALTEAVNLAISVQHRVDIIGRFADLRRVPPNVFTIMGSFVQGLPKHLGLFVIVGESNFVHAMATTFVRVYPYNGARVHITHSIERAYAIIHRARAASSV